MPPAATRGGSRDRGATAPTREQISALLSRRQQAWASRDVAGLARQHAASCVMDSHLAGRVEGQSAIAHLYEMWFTAFPDSRLATEEVIVDDDRIAEIATLSGTDSGGFLGLPATRKPFQLLSVWFYTLTNLQFVYVRPIYDFTGMLVQIGVLKAKPA
jgi:predicted ester cyclase